MSSFDNFDFSKLNLINFDKLVSLNDEELPGFQFLQHFGLVQLPKTHHCLNHPCDGQLILEKKWRTNLNIDIDAISAVVRLIQLNIHGSLIPIYPY